MRALTVKQPFADLIVAGVKDVENRSWPVPSTLPRWGLCECGYRYGPDENYPATKAVGHQRNGPHGPWSWCVGEVAANGRFPFRIWVHAAAKVNRGAVRRLVGERTYLTARHLVGDDGFAGRLGAVLGSVEVTGCHHAGECRRFIQYDANRSLPQGEHYCSRWAEPDAWHWTLADPRPIARPVPAKGMLGLWKPDVLLVNALAEAVPA
jgi:hypothetical protein